MYFLGLKHKSAIWDGTPSHLHTKPSLYVCRRTQGSQMFKQNYLNLFTFYSFYNLGFFGLGGRVAWRLRVSGVTSMSLDEFRSIQR